MIRIFTIFAQLFCFAFCAPALAQTNSEESARARELLVKARAALGGEAKLQNVRSLSLNGKFNRRSSSGQSQMINGEIKIELIAPDKLLKIEDSRPQPSVFLTTFQAMNGETAWFDRKIARPGRDDGNTEIASTQRGGRTSPISNENAGMRGIVNGETIVRTNPPGTRTTQRSVLGMPMPTPQGQDSNNELDNIEKDRRASSQNRSRSGSPLNPETPDLKSVLEKQIRREFACLIFGLLLAPSRAFPLEFKYAGEIDADQGKIEAIEISGPDQFAGRLFIDQATVRPTMLSYRELINRKAGYLVDAGGDNPLQAETEEIAVQLYFMDYRPVNGIMLPFQIVKAINGVPIDEWKIEKYRINPDLKEKRFEKKRNQ